MNWCKTEKKQTTKTKKVDEGNTYIKDNTQGEVVNVPIILTI